MSETTTESDETIDPAALAAKLAEERPADIVEALNEQIPQAAAAVLLNLQPDIAVAVLDTPSLEHTPEIDDLLAFIARAERGFVK